MAVVVRCCGWASPSCRLLAGTELLCADEVLVREGFSTLLCGVALRVSTPRLAPASERLFALALPAAVVALLELPGAVLVVAPLLPLRLTTLALCSLADSTLEGRAPDSPWSAVLLTAGW